MLIGQSADAVVVWAPAKVNLYLEVLGKRSDGYHELATLMVAVSLYDTLEFKEESSGVHLGCDDPRLSTGPDNLVCRAAALLQRRTGVPHGARIRLVKRIPMQAGLAGGSSDAAAALAGLNRLWRLRLTNEQLAALGAELGSDVPFFFATPAAWCTGRGEKTERLTLGRALWLVLVSPGVGLATADVFRRVIVPAEPKQGEDIRRAAAAGDVEELGRRLHNRLQAPAEELCPRIAEVQARLNALRPAGALMSGSGTSLFVLGRDRAEALRTAHELRHGPDEGIRVHLVRSCC